MKNFGRLDIFEENGTSINLGTDSIIYSGNNFILGNKKYSSYLFNSSGNGNVLVNSKNVTCENIEGKLFNANDIVYSGRPTILNSYSSYTNSNGLYINSINVNTSNNYNGTKLNIGRDNKTFANYILGNNISSNNTNSYDNYLIGNNLDVRSACKNSYIIGKGTHNLNKNDVLYLINECEGDTYRLVFDSSGIYNYKNDEVLNVPLIKNDALLNSADKNSLFKVSGNFWSIDKEMSNSPISSFLYNKKYTKNNLYVDGDSILYGINKNNNIIDSLVINAGKNLQLTSKNSIIMNSGNGNITANVENAVIINDGSNISITGKNGLFINSSFQISTSGLKHNDNTYISYEDMSKMATLDKDFDNIVNLVYAKTTPNLEYNIDNIKNALEDTSYKGEDLTREVSIPNNDEKNFFNIVVLKEYKYDCYIVDVYDINDNSYFRIFMDEDYTPYYDSFTNYDIKYYKYDGSNYINFTFNILNSKNKKFIVKISSFNLYDVCGMKFIDTKSGGKSYNLEKMYRNSYYTLYGNSTNIPKNVIFDGTISAGDFLYFGNVDKISTLRFDNYEGVYKYELSAFKELGSGTYNYQDLNENQKNTLQNYNNTIPNYAGQIIDMKFYTTAYNTFVANSSFSSTKQSDEGLCLDFNRTEVPISSLKQCTLINDVNKTDILPTLNPNFYKNSKASFIKWGALANFYASVKDGIAYNLSDNNTLEYDEPFTGYYKFIPIICITDFVTFEKIRPIYNQRLHIRVEVFEKSVFNNVVDAQFMWYYPLKNNGKKCIPLISIPTKDNWYNFMDYQKSIHDFVSMFKTSTKKNIVTETLTYMTQITK